MTDLHKAAKEALWAFQYHVEQTWPTDRATAAIAALRAALAQEDEMREMLRTLGFGSQCPESIGITLRRWRDGYAAALAQQEQEPVAWMVYTEDGKSAYVTDNPHDLVGAYKAFALYTRQTRREWQRLTNEEMYGLYRRAGLEAYYPRDGVVQGDYDRRIEAYVRAIEAKIKEKNA